MTHLNYPRQATRKIRVLVADENTLIRAGICRLLEKIPNVEVVGEIESGGRLLPAIKRKRPDVLLIEVGSSGLSGLGLISQVARQHADVGVIVLSSFATEEFVAQCLNAGAAGYLLKRSEIGELDSAIQAAAQGKKYLCDAVAGRFKESASDYSGNRESAIERLTTRQRQILKLIAEGRNTKEIALLMKLSPKTVAFHRVQLMQRLKIDNVPGLVRYAIRVGLVAA